MAQIKFPEKALIFAGVMVKNDSRIENYNGYFKEFGNIVNCLGPINFSEISDYYDREMGKDIQKYYLYTDKLIDPSELSYYKNLSNEIEDKLSVNGKRSINFDVGYIDYARFVLASTKNYFHRIYLKDGIYAEITLYFQDNKWQELFWTYRDYKRDDIQKLLIDGRNYLKNRIQG
jgi:hypothetical protein